MFLAAGAALRECFSPSRKGFSGSITLRPARFQHFKSCLVAPRSRSVAPSNRTSMKNQISQIRCTIGMFRSRDETDPRSVRPRRISEITAFSRTRSIYSGPCTLGGKVRAFAAKCVTPLFWCIPDNQGNPTVKNGTMFFLDAGEGPFAVTASHVYEAFLADKARYGPAVCRLSNFDFDLSDHLIDFQDNRPNYPDIATFRVSKNAMHRLGRFILGGRQRAWPPTPPDEGTGVLFAGFPRRDRCFKSPRDIDWGIYSEALRAMSVTDRDIYCRFEGAHFRDPPRADPSVSRDHDLSGMSGAPLIALDDGKESPTWRLTGVIYKQLPGFRMIRAVRADYISPAGELAPLAS